MSMFFFNLAKPEYSKYPDNDTSSFNSSYYGKRYPLPYGESLIPKTGISVSQTFANYLLVLRELGLQNVTFPNPYNITQNNLTDIGMYFTRVRSITH
jgi:hypothetical protein